MKRNFLFLFFCFVFFSKVYSYNYDLAVVGSGCSGMTVGVYAALVCNKTVLMLDLQDYGGNMLWHYDFPINFIAKEAERFYYAHKSEYCSYAQPILQKDFLLNLKQKLKIRQQILFGKLYNFLFNDIRIDVVKEAAVIKNEHTIKAGDTFYTAEKIVLATGLEPKIPDIEGLDTVDYLHGKKLLTTKDSFKSLTIIGSGVLAVEFAFVYAHLGCKVTLLSRSNTILKTFDSTIKQSIIKELESLRVTIVYNASVKTVKKNHTKIVTTATIDHENNDFYSDLLAIAVGTQANVSCFDNQSSSFLNGDYVQVDRNYQINNSKIYAIGAMTGKTFSTRTIHLQAKQFLYYLYKPQAFSYLKDTCFNTIHKLPYSPDCAYKGLTQQEAQDLYKDDLKIYSFSFDQSEQAHIDNAINGFAKFICTKKGILVGVHILGKQAGELLDFVKLNEPFYTIFLNEKDTTFPGYYNLLVRAAHLCFRDIQKIDDVELKKTFLQRVKDYLYEALFSDFKYR